MAAPIAMPPPPDWIATNRACPGPRRYLLLSKKIGIDIGCSSFQVYLRGEGIVVSEPALVAVSESHQALAVGSRARAMAERDPTRVRLVRPLRDGTIADMAVAEDAVRDLVGRVLGRQRLFRPEIMIGLPSSVSSAGRRGLAGAAVAAGARQVWMIDKPLATAIGARVPIAEPGASLVCELGGGSTEIAVIALSGMAAVKRVPGGGSGLDQAIGSHLESRHGLCVGLAAAEGLKIAIGSAVELIQPLFADVEGREVGSGRPRRLQVCSTEITEVLKPSLAAIADGVGEVLAEVPGQIGERVRAHGILLSGGAALLRNLDTFLGTRTGLRTTVVDDPQACAARGSSFALDQFEVLRRNHYVR